MNIIKKPILAIIVLLYWAVFMVMTVVESKKIGFYPASIREQAQLSANLYPYPWSEIFNAWVIITSFSVGLLLITSKTNRIPLNVLVYSFLITLSCSVLIPTDIGGVTYAISGFGFYLFISTIIYLAFTSIRNILMRKKSL